MQLPVPCLPVGGSKRSVLRPTPDQACGLPTSRLDPVAARELLHQVLREPAPVLSIRDRHKSAADKVRHVGRVLRVTLGDEQIRRSLLVVVAEDAKQRVHEGGLAVRARAVQEEETLLTGAACQRVARRRPRRR